LFKDFFRDRINVIVLFGMAHGRFLEFSALEGVDHVIVAPLKDLDESDHFLILHQVEGASTEEERVAVNDFL
jgi:hypothetical protein